MDHTAGVARRPYHGDAFCGGAAAGARDCSAEQCPHCQVYDWRQRDHTGQLQRWQMKEKLIPTTLHSNGTGAGSCDFPASIPILKNCPARTLVKICAI